MGSAGAAVASQFTGCSDADGEALVWPRREAILLLAMAFMLTVGKRLLPQGTATASGGRQRSLHDMAKKFGIADQLRRLHIQPGSSLLGKTVSEAALRREHGLTVVALQRGRWLSSLNPVLANTRLRANDIVIVAARPEVIDAQAASLQLMDLGFPHDLQRRFSESFGAAETLVELARGQHLIEEIPG